MNINSNTKELILGYAMTGSGILLLWLLGIHVTELSLIGTVLMFMIGQFLAQVMHRGWKAAREGSLRALGDMRGNPGACQVFVYTSALFLAIDAYGLFGFGENSSIAKSILEQWPIIVCMLVVFVPLAFLVGAMSMQVALLSILRAVSVIGVGIVLLACIEHQAKLAFNNYPVESAWVLIACLTLLFASNICSRINKSFCLNYREGSALGYAVTSKVTPETRSVVVAHEAGHALVYASLKELPDFIKVCVHKRPKGMALGYVTAITTDQHNVSKAFAEFSMYVALGGKIAEQVMKGSDYLGSSSDHARWETYAKPYLLNQLGEYYYAEPQNNLEVEHNAIVLKKLQVEQEAVLLRFFTENFIVLKELSEVLDEKGIIQSSELRSFLSRVILPEEMTRV